MKFDGPNGIIICYHLRSSGAPRQETFLPYFGRLLALNAGDTACGSPEIGALRRPAEAAQTRAAARAAFLADALWPGDCLGSNRYAIEIAVSARP